MKGDAKVIEYLNAALRSELTAVSQYWLHYRLQEDWGYGRIASKSRAESIEEMNHADRLIQRIIFLEGHPNLQKLDPLRIGQNIKETLEADLATLRDRYACEWQQTVQDVQQHARFAHFINSPARDPNVQFVPERAQHRPATPAERIPVYTVSLEEKA